MKLQLSKYEMRAFKTALKDTNDDRFQFGVTNHCLCSIMKDDMGQFTITFEEPDADGELRNE